MKNNHLRGFLLAVLLLWPLFGAAGGSDRAKSGYEIDGRTSASVLAAQRSHAVSKSDETGLAVVSGLMVIGVIVLLVRILTEKN